jgi:hypothetical protein
MKLKLILIILLFNSIGFSQTSWEQSDKNKASSPDSIPVIYVPGIMGSPLYDDINNDNKLTIDEKAWMGIKLPSVWLAENGIDPAGNYNIKVAPLRNDAANTLWDELNDIPMDLFKGFFDNLEANGYTLDNYDDVHNEGENLFCFTYDWRKNNTTNAELLSNFIDSVMNWTGADKVNIVGHSMGGIVSKQCINLFDKSRIRKMVFIGTPHLGAPEILTVLLTGKLFEWLNFVIADYLVRSLGRNLPSCYQLIPSRSYLNLDYNNGISEDIEIYSECFQLPNGSHANYNEMIDYLRDIVFLLGENLNDALLDSSEIFKETIDTIDFGNVNVFNIVGYNKWTIGKNRVIIGPPPFNWVSIEEERNLNGDYTVPVRSAELINNQVIEHTYYVPNIIHSGIPSGEPTLEILLGIFSDPPVTNFPQYATPPPSYKNIIVSIENDIEIPGKFYLSQNFPNPFNPSTVIRYQLAVGGYITLKLYDILGNEIGTLVNEEKSGGIYELKFYAGNLPSGAYFYQLRTEDFVETKKMILMK